MNNSAADVEQFRFLPIEWLRRMLVLTVFASPGSATAEVGGC
jgi:hypothetical protein